MNRAAITLRFCLVAVMISLMLSMLGGSAFGDDDGTVGGAVSDSEVLLSAVKEIAGTSPGSRNADKDSEVARGEARQAPRNYNYENVRYVPMCRSAEGDAGCIEVRNCPGDNLRYGLFTRVVVVTNGVESAGDWTFAGWTCRTDTGVAVSGPAPLPQVTWQMVLREVQRIGLPSLEVQVQPADKTLVNFETNFYAQPEAFERQITLLGQNVDVRATPTQFAWTFGDGETEQTDSPGAPYPDLQITHTYTDADVTVSPSVDVTYSAEFRVGDGEWEEIPETVTISGTPVSLQIVEATPVLSGEGRDH